MIRPKGSKGKKAPDGFENLQPTLEAFQDKLKDAQATALQKTSRKSEALWEIFKITHQKSRYVYEMHYKKKVISRELYDWLLKNRYADANLIAKWKKQGYENLCCIKCIQGAESNNEGTCICRVPKATLEKNKNVTFKECINCGCHGCSSSD